MSTENKLLVFHIQRFVLHDGPGIRTTVFLKGCPLRCNWCHNPEGLQSFPELGYISSRCELCQKCVNICPENAIKFKEKKVQIDREICSACFKCVDVCPSKALEIIGEYKTTEEILSEVMSDIEFYEQSEGGLTLSGGEPLSQSNGLLELLKKAKRNNLHICLDTTGYCDWETFEKILEYVDIILYDVKQLKDEEHKRLTGVSNQLILENLKLCLKKDVKIIVRIPVILGQNFADIESELEEYIKNLIQIGVKKFELIPYHKFGEQKYEMLDKEYIISVKDINSNEIWKVVNNLHEEYDVSIKVSKPIIT